jgi:hypothetical protein
VVLTSHVSALQVQDVEGKLPPKVPVIVKVPMTPYQSAIYNWVKVGVQLTLAAPSAYKEACQFCIPCHTLYVRKPSTIGSR